MAMLEMEIRPMTAGDWPEVRRIYLEGIATGNGIWTLQAGIFPENVASITLHTSRGFRKIGRRERIGKMDDIWRDVVLLERRSSVAGT